jgi:cytochrome c oxidase subunit I
MTATKEEVLPQRPEPRRGPLLEWLTTTDHKKIGVMYLVNSFLFFVIGGGLALTMRTQLIRPNNTVVSTDFYNQAVSIHGTLMIFLVIFPFLAGFGNYFVPLQIGALDMAFPRVNALSFWLLPVGGLTIASGFFVPGGAAAAGWTNYVPLSAQQSGAGEDLWLLGLLIVGVSSILGAINFIVTILRMRAPGVSMVRMPIFCWATLSTSLLVVLATPVFTAALMMLLADRNFGTTFFEPSKGGAVAYWLNTFWFFGHPEVYMLILGAWGIVSEIIPVFSGKPLYGYKGVIVAFTLISGLSFAVWAHHMFTTGLVPNLSFFAATTELISVPTGVLFFNWLATMWGGKIRLEPPMLFALGFVVLFLIGGIDGVWMAQPAMDYSIHDTYWVVAHIHYVLFGGTLFGIMAGLYYWFPKISGRKLNKTLGYWHFGVQFVGFNLTFFPMHMLGLQGMPRRIAIYHAYTGWGPLNLLASIGAYLIGVSIMIFVLNVAVTLLKPRTEPADPWGGYSLEWATSSPPPPHNFDELPPIRSSRPVYDQRKAIAAMATGAGDDGGQRP